MPCARAAGERYGSGRWWAMTLQPWLRRLTLAACGVALATPANSAPQINVAVQPGLAHLDDSGLAFYGAVAGDVLFTRARTLDAGVGPRLEVGTVAFDDLRLAAGPTLLLHLSPLEVQPSLSALLRVNDAALSGGLSARVFVGVRPYNHTHPYGAAFGLSLGLDQLLYGAERERAIVLAAHLDAMWLSLPFLALASLW